MNPIFMATSNGTGKLVFVQPEAYQRHLSTLVGQVEVVVRLYKSNRSGNQNRYYFGIVVEMISKETGYSKDETHEILRSLFLTEIVYILDEEVKIAKSTASLNTKSFEEYLERVRHWAQVVLNCRIPLPNEVDY